MENEEELFICRSKKGGSTQPAPQLDTINITLTVIDVNDPPEFEKNVTDVYQREEEEPGQVMFKPKINDVDSDVNKIRWVALHGGLFKSPPPLSPSLTLTMPVTMLYNQVLAP